MHGAYPPVAAESPTFGNIMRVFPFTGRVGDQSHNFVDYEFATGLRIGNFIDGTHAADAVPIGSTTSTPPAAPPQGFIAQQRLPATPQSSGTFTLAGLPAGTNRVEIRAIGQGFKGEWTADGAGPTAASGDDPQFGEGSWWIIQGAATIAAFSAKVEAGPGQFVIQAYETPNAEDNPMLNHGIGTPPADSSFSDRHDFTGVTAITAADLLTQSGRGNSAVTEALITVKSQTDATPIVVVDGTGTANLDQGGYVTVDDDATWTITLQATDIVRIAWSEQA